MTSEIENFILQKKAADVTWIVCTEKHSVLRHLAQLADAKGIKIEFAQNFRGTKEHDQLIRSEIQKIAAKSFLFYLVFANPVHKNSYETVRNLIFQLKNLGFCRVVTPCKENADILQNLCSEHNIYFDLLPCSQEHIN